MAGHGFCSQCGAALEAQVREGREIGACPACQFLAWPDPKLVTAVVIEDSAGRVLLARRGIEPGYGLWCLPGGFVNDDEAPAAAAARECREEVAADLDDVELLGAFHIAPRPGRRGMVCLGYRGRLAAGAAPRAAEETLEVGVFAADRLPELVFPSHREVITEWRNRRRSEGGEPAG